MTEIAIENYDNIVFIIIKRFHTRNTDITTYVGREEKSDPNCSCVLITC